MEKTFQNMSINEFGTGKKRTKSLKSGGATKKKIVSYKGKI